MAAAEIDVKYVAHLARIALSPEEEQKLGAQLGNILGYIEKLNQADVSGVEPTAHAFPLVNVTRPDEARPSMSNDEALRNAPEAVALYTEALAQDGRRPAPPRSLAALKADPVFAADLRDNMVALVSVTESAEPAE